MKGLITILFLFSFAYGQNFHTRLDNPLPQAYGNIYYKTNWTNTADFTINGDIAVSVVSNQISMTCTTTGTLSQYATLGTFTNLSKWVFTNTFTAATPAATSFGNAIGTRSYININYDCIGHVGQESGGNKGEMVIERGDGTLLANNAPGAFAFSAGDVITQTLIYNDSVATYTCQNITTAAAPVSISFTYSVASTTQFTPSMGYFAIYEIGGTQVNSLISITSNAVKNSNILLLGDSKIKGYHTTTWNRRMSYLMDPVFPTSVIHAGGSETLFNQNQEIAEILAMNPKYCILLGGSNDPRTPYSRTVAATAASYDSLYNTLTAAGIICLTGVIPEDSTLSGANASVGLTAFKNYVSAKYASSYIDFWTPMTTAGDNKLKSSMDFGDGIHPNDLGNAAMAKAVINCGLLSSSKIMDSIPIAGGSSSGGTGTPGTPDSSVQYNNHGAFNGISQALWNSTMLRLESTSWLLNLSVGHSLDGMFLGSSGVDGGSISGGGYYNSSVWKAAGSTAFSSFTLAGGLIAFYCNPTVTPFSTITPSLQYVFGATGATFTPPLTVTGGFAASVFNSTLSAPAVSTTGRTVTFGTLGIQNFSALNNVLVLENADNITGTLTYKATGFAEIDYYQVGHRLFFLAPSGTAGTTISAGVIALDLFSSSATFGVNTLPVSNVGLDLGSASLAWRDVYFSHPVGKSAIGVSSGLGTNVSSLTPSGNDAHFSFSIVTSGNVSGTLGLIAFGRSWGATPICTISIANAATGAAVTGGYYGINATSVSSMTVVGSLTGAGTYVFNCHCGQ